jgi:hypothetical protein
LYYMLRLDNGRKRQTNATYLTLVRHTQSVTTANALPVALAPLAPRRVVTLPVTHVNQMTTYILR